MTITVQCPSCSTTFPVDPAKVPEKGVHARCSHCSGVFFVARPPQIEDAAAEATPDEVRAPEAGEGAWGAAATAGPETEEAPSWDVEESGSTEVDEAPAPEVEEAPFGEVEEAPSTEVEQAPAAEVEEAPSWDVEPTFPGEIEETAAWDAPYESGATSEPGAAAPEPSVEEAEDWVFEREPELDPSSLDVQPMETVENSQGGFFGGPSDGEVERSSPPDAAGPGAGDMATGGGGGEAGLEIAEPELPPSREAGELASPGDEMDAEPSSPSDSFFGAAGAAPQEAPPAEPPAPSGERPEGQVPESAPAPPAQPAGFQFGRRDPHEKAQRLARVLVSDMIMYNPERHARALDGDSLPEDFADEIKKSWEEYVDQVGDDLARGTTYFSEALNEILAKGRELFRGSPPTA